MTYPQQVPSYGPPSGSDPYVNYQQAQYPPRYDYPPPPPHPSMYAPAPVQHYSYYEQGPHIPPQASSQPPVAPQFNTSSSTAAPTSVSSNAPSADFSATSASNSSSTTAPSVPQSQRPQSPATRYPIPPPPSHILPPQHPYYTTMPPPQQPYSYGVYGAIYPQSTSSLAPSANMEPWGTPPAGGWGANNGNSEGYVSHHGQQQPGNDRIQLAPLRVGSSPTSNSPSSISPVSSTSAQRGHNSNFPVVQLRGNREHEDRERARKDRDGGKRNPLSIGSIISDETS
ncbi:hypothetical protein C8J56DRAFT_928313 [Mycena floridula]|nr:hypothetical protein C8J56DRAFT_928313 [Mycena floridula]